jgi:hypothetical protein
MSCTPWNERLIGRLYGEIAPDADAALTEHLESCSRCRDTLAELGHVRTLLRDNEPLVPPAPRVMVLRERSRFRPALLAASWLGAIVLAGAAAGAGFAFARGLASASPAHPEPVATSGVSTEDLIKQEVDRRLAAWQSSQQSARSKATKPPETPNDPPVSASALRAELAKFERRVNGARAADLDYVLDQLAASEQRVGTRIGKTNQALRTVALANGPGLSEQ